MPRRELTLPDYYAQGIKDLAELREDQAKELVSALRGEEPVYYNPNQLADSIASKVSIDKNVVAEVIRTLAGLYMGRAVTGLAVPEFAQTILEAIEKKGLKPPEPQSWARLRDYLVQLLQLEGALPVASKALNVITEQDRIFSQSRILSDLRSVFKDDPEVPPWALAVIHTLRIHYYQSGELKAFFVAMDDEDIRKLKETLDRAQKKSRTLRALAASAKIPVINIEGQPET
jgi:hypothetical protein